MPRLELIEWLSDAGSRTRADLIGECRPRWGIRTPRHRFPELVTSRVLLVSGSLRSASTNTALLETLSQVSPGGYECHLYRGLGSLPPFDPDLEDDPPSAVVALRSEVHTADALLVSTPEYAGALPGAFKNLLDWTIGDSHPRSIYDKPVAWLNASTRGARDAHEELQRVLTYAHADVIEEACVPIPVTASMVSVDGIVSDPHVREVVVGALDALVGRLPGASFDRPSH